MRSKAALNLHIPSQLILWRWQSLDFRRNLKYSVQMLSCPYVEMMEGRARIWPFCIVFIVLEISDLGNLSLYPSKPTSDIKRLPNVVRSNHPTDAYADPMSPSPIVLWHVGSTNVTSNSAESEMML
ncbi:hypothetical protein ABKN59_006677 [Abortiporus biennis]